jgi:hypothetical protein
MDAAAGGVFGIVGTALGRVAGFFERKQTFKHEVQRWSHEYKLHELQMAASAQETEMEIALTAQQGSWKGQEPSIKADAAIGKASKWVINVLRLVRPVLTILLWLITAWIFAVTQESAIVEAAVFAATAATLWWFGDRAPKPPLKP